LSFHPVRSEGSSGIFFLDLLFNPEDGGDILVLEVQPITRLYIQKIDLFITIAVRTSSPRKFV
jgi:hypothetical protein